MTILDRFVLPTGVVIEPVSLLEAALYEQLDCEPSDYYITRPRSRTVSSIVDRKTAALLRCFESPTTIVDAVRSFSVAEGLDPREVLDDAFGTLAAMANDGLLLPETSASAQPIESTLQVGERLSRFTIVELLQILEDTEVYLARDAQGDHVALKIAHSPGSSGLSAMFTREAEILRVLDARVTPRLLEVGESAGRPFVALEWRMGVDLLQAASELRGLPEQLRQSRLQHLAQSVLDAYAHLHSQGVLHGDVHPRNVLVSGNGDVSLVDFGLGSDGGSDSLSNAWRGGIALYQEPELAHARVNNLPLPAVAAAGEQYAIGTLLYQVLTGFNTHSFSLQHEAMLHQISHDPPLPFESHGCAYSPQVEACVLRSLAKEPQLRHASVAAFAEEFRAAAGRELPVKRAFDALRGRPGNSAEILLTSMLDQLDPIAHGFREDAIRPFVSVMNGAAGIAFFHLRVAMARNDAMLLAQSDLWSTRAVLSLDADNAFWNPSLGVTPDVVGEASLFHHASGVHVVHALVAHARGDRAAQTAAVTAFVASAQACEQVDVSFGRAGLLIGCTMLVEALGEAGDLEGVRAFGDRLCDALWHDLESSPPIAGSPLLSSLGAAHGWAGVLHAILRWSEVALLRSPSGLVERLYQLATLGRPVGRGLLWPIALGLQLHSSALDASWCNGAAGFVYLWVAADKTYPGQGFMELAELAAWGAYEHADDAHGTLCCGLAGRAYALRHLFAQTNDDVWLARAQVLRDRAVAAPHGDPARKFSLFQGELGIALLAAELERPEFACMPLYEGG